MALLREVAAKLGVDVDSKALEGFMGTIDKAKASLSGLATAFAGSAVVGFISDQIDATAAIGSLATKLGMGTGEVQKLSYALERSGLSAENAEKAMIMLNKVIGDAVIQKNTKRFDDMGVKIKDANGKIKPTIEVLRSVADAAKKSGNATEVTSMALALFGESAKDLIPLLMKGSAGVDELMASFEEMGGVIEADVIAQARETKKGLKDLKSAFGRLTDNAIAPLLPLLVAVAKNLAKWSGAFAKLIKHSNAMRVALLMLAVVASVKLLPMLWSLISTFFTLSTSIFGMAVPLWLVIGVLAILFLALEDLYTLMAGGDSVIGTLLDRFGGLGTKEKFVTSLKDAWKKVVDIWGSAKKAFDDLAGSWTKGEGVLGLLKFMIDGLVKSIQFLIDAYAKLGGAKGTKIYTGDEASKKLAPGANEPGAFGKAIQGAASIPLGADGAGIGVAGNTYTVPNWLSKGIGKLAAPINNVTGTVNMPVTITTTGDAKETADTLKKTNMEAWHAVPGYGVLK